MAARAILAGALLLATVTASRAQKQDPIQWSLAVSGPAAPGSTVLARLTATSESGWHLYSMTTPKPPIATTVVLAANPAVERTEVFQPAPVRKFDPNFQSDTETFEGSIVFLLKVQLKSDLPAGPIELVSDVRYQACSDKLCLPPRKKSASASLTIDPAAKAQAVVIPAGYALPGAPRSAPPQASAQAQTLPAFLLVAFGFGLAAIFTPCVFPMIPITMSFFLNRTGNGRGDSIVQASIFCLGIIALFSSLGLAATALLGPFGAVQLGSNPWVNAFIAVVFGVFALSLLGAFEITLPSGLLTRLDSASRKGGAIGTLIMGLTFSLTAFACVGPFMGTLLAASVQDGGAKPALGMLSFATGLASPFFLLALFPAWLQRLPRSGGWLVRVKIVLGFVVLAAMLKYVANVDQVLQWNVITRERFLAAWFVLFALPGLYLLGLLALEGIKRDEPLTVHRLLAGAAFLVFAFSLLPGMFGGRLGELDAYVPPPAESSIGASNAAARLPWMKNQYREALARARAEGKLLFVNFTGYACTNCHWMKSNMFPRPEIDAAMRQFVLLELYTDGADTASEENQKLQESLFSTVAIPFYAILDADAKVIATFPGLTRNPSEFLAFLQSGKPAS